MMIIENCSYDDYYIYNGYYSVANNDEWSIMN
jgi:hypothetical protein